MTTQIVFKRMFQRENVVALILITASIIGFFGLHDKLGITTEQLILLMLGFLAIDALIEKVGYLEEIETNTKSIKRTIHPHPDMVLIERRENLEPFPDRIQGKKNIFILAISANSLVTQYSSDIEKSLESGTNFRLVLASPDNPALQALSLAVPTKTVHETHIRWINDSLDILRSIAKKDLTGKLEVRLLNDLPTASMIAYDAFDENGWIQVEPHIYRKTPSNRPLFILRREYQSKWYPYFLDSITNTWESSSVLSLDPDNEIH